LFSVGEYEQAKVAFEQASELKPNESEPLRKISLCEANIARLEQLRIDKEYKENIILADRAFANKEYDKAKSYYITAINIKNESYPRIKLEEIDKLLEVKEAKTTDFSILFERNEKSVFLIIAYDRFGDAVSQGTGFFVSSNGVAVTNHHVFNDKITKIKITTSQSGTYEVERRDILDYDAELDYVIFRVNTYGSLPYLKIAKTTPKIGESVFTIGNPEGLLNTMTNGIVSSIRNDYIQTNTAITHGSSGGPLFNSYGEVIGITTMGKQEGSIFFSVIIQRLSLGRFIK